MEKEGVDQHSRPMCEPLPTHFQRVGNWSFVLDERVALLVVIVLASAFRFAFLGHDSLSHDEAGRALRYWLGSFDEIRLTPPLQYATMWITAHTIGGSDFGIRLPSVIAGLACVVVIFLLVRRYVDTWSAFFAAASAAFHPELIRYSRVAKEFSIEALVCVAITWAGLSACDSPSRRTLLVFSITAILGIGFSFTGSLVVCAWMIPLGVILLRSKEVRKKALSAYVITCVSCGSAVAVWYWWLSGAYRLNAIKDYMGGQYGAWPASYDFTTLASWCLSTSYGALRYTLGITSMWPPLDALCGAYGLIAALASICVFRRMARSFGLFAIVLILLTVFAGVMKQWPYGPYHTMTFLAPLMCIAIGCGLRQIADKFGISAVTAALVIVCLIIPAARACKYTIIDPPETEHIRPILQRIQAQSQPGDGLFAYYPTRFAVRRYLPPDGLGTWDRASIGVDEESYHMGKECDLTILLQPTCDRGRLDLFASRFDRFAASQQRVWFVFSHDYRDERKDWIGYLEEQYRLKDTIEIADAKACLFEKRYD